MMKILAIFCSIVAVLALVYIVKQENHERRQQEVNAVLKEAQKSLETIQQDQSYVLKRGYTSAHSHLEEHDNQVVAYIPAKTN